MSSYNYFSEENKATVQSFTSQILKCSAQNILNKDKKYIWFSKEGLPQAVTISTDLMIKKEIIYCFGIYCWHAYQTNPKVIELITTKGKVKTSIGIYELELKSGTQLFYINNGIDLSNINSIEIKILDTFGSNKVYINNIYGYKDFPEVEVSNIYEHTLTDIVHNQTISNNNNNSIIKNIVNEKKDLSESEISVDFEKEIEERIREKEKVKKNYTDATSKYNYLISEVENKSKGRSLMNKTEKPESAIDKIKKNIMKSRNSSIENKNNKHPDQLNNNDIIEDVSYSQQPYPIENKTKKQNDQLHEESNFLKVNKYEKHPNNDYLLTNNSPKNEYKQLEQQLLKLQLEVKSLDKTNNYSATQELNRTFTNHRDLPTYGNKDKKTYNTGFSNKDPLNYTYSKTPDKNNNFTLRTETNYNSLVRKGFDQNLLREFFEPSLNYNENNNNRSFYTYKQHQPPKQDTSINLNKKEPEPEIIECNRCISNSNIIEDLKSSLQIKENDIKELKEELNQQRQRIDHLSDNIKVDKEAFIKDMNTYLKDECQKVIKNELQIFRLYIDDLLNDKLNKQIIEQSKPAQNPTMKVESKDIKREEYVKSSDLKEIISDLFQKNIQSIFKQESNSDFGKKEEKHHKEKENTSMQKQNKFETSTNSYKKKFDLSKFYWIKYIL